MLLWGQRCFGASDLQKEQGIRTLIEQYVKATSPALKVYQLSVVCQSKVKPVILKTKAHCSENAVLSLPDRVY